MNLTGTKQWYVLHTYSGHERKVAKRLHAHLKIGEDHPVTNVVVPSEQVTEVRDGKKRTVTHIFLQGYLLLEMTINDDNWQDVCASIIKIEGVTGFAGLQYGKKPRPINKEEASTILQKAGLIKGSTKVDLEKHFMEGEAVRILVGPFESFTGNVDEVDVEKKRLRVSVGIFGRTTPVEVDMTEVERL